MDENLPKWVENFARISLFLVLGFGLLAMLLYAAGVTSSRSDFITVSGTSILYAGAALAVGGLLGFLFGVPHSSSSTTGASVTPNTNLEQISDWLTKVLVGATLVELANVPSAGGSLFSAMASGLGGFASSAAVAGAIVVYYSVIGFLTGWLNTRLYLGRAMRDADAVQKLQGVSALHKAGALSDDEFAAAKASILSP